MQIHVAQTLQDVKDVEEFTAGPTACRAVAEALFMAREPHLIHEALAFAKPPQWGLVP